MPNFLTLLFLAISTDENNPITFSKPAPEASPVLTLGKYFKGQVRTNYLPASYCPIGCSIPLRLRWVLERVNQVYTRCSPRGGNNAVGDGKSYVISPLITREIYSNSVRDGLSRTSDQQCNQTRFLYYYKLVSGYSKNVCL